MQRPSFSVVTGVVVILTVLAFLSKLVVGSIPAGPANRLASEQAEFLAQAGNEEVDWRPLSEEAFSEARKRDRPIMLVVGSACSPTGRMSDKVVFMTKEIRGYLARNFVCVRVDSMARPEFANAFLPISRAIKQARGRLAIPPDYQVWFLDPKGFLFGYAAEMVAGVPLDPRAFLLALTDAVSRFERLQNNRAKAGIEQRRDLEAIATAPIDGDPNLVGFANDLADAGTGEFGGFPNNGFQRLWPAAWRFLLVSGRFTDYARSIGPCLVSPQVDLVDGGFFTDFSSQDWRLVGFDKLAVANAGMLETLALGAVLMSSDEQQKWLALNTFDALADQFPQEGFIAGGRIGDDGVLNRSARSSFSPRVLRDLFPDADDREWVRQKLGLMVETNPQMVPLLSQLDLPMVDPKHFNAAMQVLRKDRPTVKYAGVAFMDVGGFTTARMMQAARILGDEDRLSKAEALFMKLDEFRTANDVVHSKAPGAGPGSYLGDYLAYADASLQYYLSTGNEVVLRNGLAVLRRGLFLYKGSVSGVYTLSQRATSPLAAQDAACPEIVDNVRESCTAQVIRLCDDYGRLLGNSGEDLKTVAQEAAARFSAISPALGQYAAGYFCAMAKLQEPAFAVTVGKDAPELARRLSRKAPLRLVAPAGATVAAPGKADGIYVISESGTAGPLSLDKAVEALRLPTF